MEEYIAKSIKKPTTPPPPYKPTILGPKATSIEEHKRRQYRLAENCITAIPKINTDTKKQRLIGKTQKAAS